MTTMNDATKMAVTLARKGASDEVIALVMEALTPQQQPPALTLESPAANAIARDADSESRYRPLLDAIRKQVAASGPVESTARELCERHRKEWMMSRVGRNGNLTARGFAAVVANSVKRTDNGVGVLCGVGFTLVRRIDNGGGSGACVYRIESV